MVSYMENALVWVEANALSRKLIGSALRKSGVPDHLRDDAAQEIRLDWHKASIDPSRGFSRAAAYAHRIAINCGLRIRRKMANPVAIPGQAFRRGLVSPECVSPTAELDDTAEWLVLGEEHEVEVEPVAEPTYELSPEMVAGLRKSMTATEYALVLTVVEGGSLDDYAKKHRLAQSSVYRKLGAVMSKVHALKAGM